MNTDRNPGRMSPGALFRFRAMPLVAAFLATMLGLAAEPVGAQAQPTPTMGVKIPDSPIFVVADNRPNVLLILDNSNSMDESATGAAVGSNSPESKSEIARGVLEGLVTDYQGRISLGLMAYKQNSPSAGYLHNSPYDVSYDPNNYDPEYTGGRDSSTKKFRQPNPSSPGDYVYYNIALPFYAGSNQGTLFCYSSTADFDNGSEEYPGGPWDRYGCYRKKTGTSDGAPPGGGYSEHVGNYSFYPTDSDLAQNILDFGRRMSSYYISRTWMRNDSPGRGYLHVPIGNLDSAQAAAINAKLQCNIPGQPAPCSAEGIKNAGLTPLQGTLLTARDYLSGSWSNTSEGYTSDVYPLPQTCARNYVILLTDGLPSTDKDGNVVSSPEAGIKATADAAAALLASGVETYVVGFALPFGTDPKTLDSIAEAGGTGTAYNAGDSDSLDAALESIFQDIEAKSGSSGATTTNTTGLSTDSMVFKASFNPTTWSGDLAGYPVTASGVSGPPTWAADVQSVSDRNLLMTQGDEAVEFTWDNLTDSQRTLLGEEDVVDYLRGDRSGEGDEFRKRGSLLGDIVHSAPTYMKERERGKVGEIGYRKAAEVIFVGANDGFLHAFDVSDDSSNELFAYMPAGINLSDLADTARESYSKSHKYFVDGQIAVSTRAGTSGDRNILVATLGRGGRGAFALDVTDPANPTLLWDHTGANAIAGMEHILGAPFITILGDDGEARDVAIIPNGVVRAPDTGANIASLLIIDLDDGTLVNRIDAVDPDDDSNLPNGLSSPRGWDEDGDGTTDLVYAGDLHGNLWKFDVDSGNDLTAPLFVAVDGSGKRQPITGGVSISVSPLDYQRWIHFGTGRFLNSDDFSNRDVQTLYGLKDQDDPINSGKSPNRSMLHARKIVSEAGSDPVLRFFEPAGPLDDAKKGWYIDLLDPSLGAEGERVTGTPQEVAGQLRVSTGIPGSSACTPAGGGFVYILDAFTGASTPYQAIDTNGDGKVDDNDKTDGKTTGGVGGDDAGLLGDVTQNGDVLSYGGSKNVLESLKVKDEAARGRVSWRELVRD